jgi:hypothetical protein
MQWEYCQIRYLVRDITAEEEQHLQTAGFAGDVLHESDPVDGPLIIVRQGTLRLLSRPREESEAFTDLGAVVTRLGLEGWELVSHSHAGSNATLYFKRPLQASGTTEEGPNPLSDYRG